MHSHLKLFHCLSFHADNMRRCPVQVKKLCEFMVPLLRKVMSRLTQETLQDWAQLASEVSVSRRQIQHIMTLAAAVQCWQ